MQLFFVLSTWLFIHSPLMSWHHPMKTPICIIFLRSKNASIPLHMAGSSWGQVHPLLVFSSLTFSAHRFETLHAVIGIFDENSADNTLVF